MEMERTNTFETKLQEVLALEEQVSKDLQAAIREVNVAESAHEEEYRRLEEEERCLSTERRDFERRWLLQPNYRFSECNAEMAFIGDQMAEEAGELIPEDFTEAAILGRKVHHGKLYYKVAWRGRNMVTWELESDIDNKRMIAEFDRIFFNRAMMEKSTRLRPAVYVSRRIQAMRPQLRERLEVVRQGRGGRVTWSCEVEPHIWIPYDEEDQRAIEASFTSGADSHRGVFVNNVEYCLWFDDMIQRRAAAAAPVVPAPPPPQQGGWDEYVPNQVAARGRGAGRPIQRFVQLPIDAEVAMLATMTVEELREYIANIAEIMPHHYEALQRFHDADKIQHRATVEDLNNVLLCMTFEEVMNQVVEGKEFLCFSSECFVCLEDYVGDDSLAHLPCGHFFHKGCAFEYFQKYSRFCPICKEAVL